MDKRISKGASIVSGIAMRYVISCAAILDSEKQISVAPGQYLAVCLLVSPEAPAVAVRARKPR